MNKYLDYELNWYALYLAIVKRITAEQAMREMGVGKGGFEDERSI